MDQARATGPDQRPEAGSDGLIKEQICRRLMTVGEGIDASEITVDVVNGAITLRGAVPDAQMKVELEAMVDAVAQGRRVENFIVVTYGEHHAVHAERDGGEDSVQLSIGGPGGTSGSGTGHSSTAGSESE